MQRSLFPTSFLTAPAHPYDPKTETGIQWSSEVATMMLTGERIDQAAHQTASPYHFWLDRHYRWCFPDITHWWFGSPWTGRVRVDAQVVARDAQTEVGWLSWDGDGEPGVWTCRQIAGSNWLLEVPLPPLAPHAANIPLQRRLAQVIWEAQAEPLLRDQPVVVSSLVTPAELDRMVGGQDLPEGVFLATLGPTLAGWPQALGLTHPDRMRTGGG